MSQNLAKGLSEPPKVGTHAQRLEPIPKYVTEWLTGRGISPDAVELAISSDLDEDGHSSKTWVLCTREGLYALPEDTTLPRGKGTRGGGAGSGKVDESRVRIFPFTQVVGLQMENLTGNGLLVAQMKQDDPAPCEVAVGNVHETARQTGEGPPPSAPVTEGAPEPVDYAVCRFSNSQARKFGLFVRLAEKIRKGEAIQDSDIREDQIPAYCPKCGRMSPEPNRPVCPKCTDRRSIFLRVLSFVPHYKVQISLIILCMLISSAFRLLSPYMNGRVLFDEVLTPGGRWEGMIGPMVLVMFGTQLLALLTSIAYGRINAAMTAQVIFDLKTQVFAAMQRLSLRFFAGQKTGGLMTRVNHDAMHLQYFFHDGVPYFLVNVLMLLGVLSIMLVMNWRLTLLVLVPVPIIMWLMRIFLPYFWRLYSRRFQKTSSLTALINDALTGVRVIKAFGKEEAEISRFSSRNADLYAVIRESGNFGSTLFPTLTFVMSLGSLGVWGLGGWDVITGKITFGTLMSFVGYLGMLYGPLEFLTQVADWWSSCMNSAQRIFEILDANPDVAEHPRPVRLPRIRGEVELSGITFGYEPHKPVLHNISLHVEAGEMIGLVGHSGAGKSTITNLVTRLYDVDEGVIRIDGVNVKEIAMRDLRSQIGMVLQDTFLFAGSVAENISYARADATPETILRAAKAANAHDFIVALPDGYDTFLGRQGKDLSGGEKQRLAIARAILHDPRILILDEATSSVDTETEQKIQQALMRLVSGRTTFAIAHRLSTLRNARRLFVLEQGKNVELGTHEELVAKGGVYSKLLQIQREALKIRGVDEEMMAEVEKNIEKQSQTIVQDPADIRYLAPEELHFARTPGGFLSLSIGEAEHYPRVTVYRSFPFTRPQGYISVRDAKGKEIGIIKDLSQLPGATVKLIEEELDRRYFTPRIERVKSVKEEFGYTYWEVETDRGPRRFTVRNSQESVLPLSESRVVLIDVDGNRFEIPDYRALDPKAFRQIEAML